MSIQELKQKGKSALKGNWGKLGVAVLITFALLIFDALITIALAPNYELFVNANGQLTIHPSVTALFVNYVVTIATTILLTAPIGIGFWWFLIDLYDGKKMASMEILQSWKQWGRIVQTFLWMILYLFLWSLLFTIPGIIKSYSYSLAFTLIKDNPDMRPHDAITESRRLMNGNKGKLFVLQLSFIGWLLIPLVNLFYGLPYMCMSMVAFERSLVKKKS